ncbi:hypothetical protein [Tsuneonella sp. HG222]
MRALIAALPLLALLAACDQKSAPVEEVAETAEELVGADKPEAPRLATGPYAPRNACGDLKGADVFLQDLASAVNARDADALVALAAEDVKLDFGDGAGTVELRRRLQADDRKLWQELSDLLTLGCAPNKSGGLTIPWYFEQDFGGADPFMSMLVTGEAVPMLKSPEEGAEVIEPVSWDVVQISTLKPDDAYQQIKAKDGKTGYIETGKLRSLVDYRLLASSRNGKWRIVSLVAGD